MSLSFLENLITACYHIAVIVARPLVAAASRIVSTLSWAFALRTFAP